MSLWANFSLDDGVTVSCTADEDRYLNPVIRLDLDTTGVSIEAFLDLAKARQVGSALIAAADEAEGETDV